MLGPVVPSSPPYSGNRNRSRLLLGALGPPVFTGYARGGVPYVRVSNAIRVRPADVEDFLSQGRG